MVIRLTNFMWDRLPTGHWERQDHPDRQDAGPIQENANRQNVNPQNEGVERQDAGFAQEDLSSIPAGWPENVTEGCTALDPAAVLQANRRSFALRVRGQSMIGAGIYDGDIVIGDFTPEARPGAIVVALIDGESTLKRFVTQHGQPCLASENPSHPDHIPLSELVIQGVVHTVVRRV